MDRQSLLYRDAHLIVVNKPSGLLTHRGWAGDRDTALSRARDMLGTRVYLPHRLDRATSGALLLALDPDVLQALSRAFERGEIHKQYLALVRGHVQLGGRIDHPLRRDGSEEPQPAVTDFACIARAESERCSLLRLWPRSGRTHQLRRHLKHISHPIVGDTRYGKGEINRHYRTHYGLHRLALHAELLGFEHPITGARVEVRAPLPQELMAALERILPSDTQLDGLTG
ncbi:MAG: pseudouridine synthase [Myxococcales bacterium]|nr:pseudouridine synthase [Myxococcales bacterium]